MTTPQQIKLPAEAAGQRLDVFMVTTMPEHSRSYWKQLIQAGHVTVNGQSSKPNYKLKTDDVLSWTLPEVAPSEPQPEKLPLEILFEDAALLVLNKSADCVVHPAPGNETGTLVNALLFHNAAFANVERAGIVHRLDKDTSGVLVVAKTPEALAELQRQFKARETSKEYLALVWGTPPPSGRIETQIGRHPVHRQKMAVLKEGGRKAITNFKTVAVFDGISQLSVGIETGRTHQIRVHLAHLGHPVVGDRVYGRARKSPWSKFVTRQMLHAARLEFSHPCTGKRLSFEAPLPDDVCRFLKNLRNEHHGGSNLL